MDYGITPTCPRDLQRCRFHQRVGVTMTPHSLFVVDCITMRTCAYMRGLHQMIECALRYPLIYKLVPEVLCEMPPFPGELTNPSFMNTISDSHVRT